MPVETCPLLVAQVFAEVLLLRREEVGDTELPQLALLFAVELIGLGFLLRGEFFEDLPPQRADLVSSALQVFEVLAPLDSFELLQGLFQLGRRLVPESLLRLPLAFLLLFRLEGVRPALGSGGDRQERNQQGGDDQKMEKRSGQINLLIRSASRVPRR